MFKKKTKNSQLLNSRLTLLMEKQRLTISALSEKSGVAVGTIQKMMRDDSCNPTIFSLAAICKALGTSVAQLLEQHAPTDTDQRVVPLFDWQNLTTALDDFTAACNRTIATGHSIHAANIATEDAFALTMIGNSMWPAFPEGAILVFNKNKKPYDGAYVLVSFTDSEMAFKQLLIDEPYRYVKSIHPTLGNSLLKLTANDKILAILIQAKINYCQE